MENQTYDLLQNAHAALVTSGTATLETVLFRAPQVVCYKAGRISYWLAKWLVNKDLKFISIVNLIAGKQVVEELIQHNFTVEQTANSLLKILGGKHRAEMLNGYEQVRTLLGPTNCTETAADFIVSALKKKLL